MYLNYVIKYQNERNEIYTQVVDYQTRHDLSEVKGIIDHLVSHNCLILSIKLENSYNLLLEQECAICV